MTTTTALTSAVRPHNGAPALFIDGRPHTGLMFWHSKMHEAGPDLRLFAAAGVQLITTGFGDVVYRHGAEALEYRRVDAQMAAVLDAHPDALVLPRVGLNPPAWWAQAYPEEMDRHYDVGSGDPIHYRVSFSSRPWRWDAAEALRAFVRYCEARYADRIFGYHLCAGDCGEWAYAWRPVIGEFSPAQVRGFRAWLKEKYGDVDALRAAWGDPDADFATVDVPYAERLRPVGVYPRPWSLFDPAREMRCIDYQRYHSEVVADAVTHFCGVAKAELAALGREKVCGVFYGYHFVNLRIPYALQGSGHHALEPVLASPDVDFLCAPLNYQERQAGGSYLSQLLPGSLRLRGKLFYDEDDTFTHRASYTPWRYICPDAATTAHV
ncbi:MAG TPA: beta-galactosidase, partial [Armatimonadota bacterium]|nr:beta-galactosidase [Armatimonadota bacterium]